MNRTTDDVPRSDSAAFPQVASDLGQIRAVADYLPQLAWSCLPDGHCDYLSRRWVEYTGVPEAEHHGRGWLDAVHPDDRERTRQVWDAFVAGAADYDVDYRLRRHDGAYLWFKTRGVLVRDAGGNPVRVFGTTTDIDTQKQTDEKLREIDERVAFVRKASGVGFWYCDLPFDVLEWDDLVKEHFHLAPDARVTIGTFYDRIHADDREPTREAIERSIADRAVYDVHYRTVHPETGAQKWIRAIGRTSYAADGTPRRFDGVTLDVTAQRRAEEQLRESEERFRAFMDNNPAATWVTDAEGRIRYVNATYRRLFKFPAREIVGAFPSDLYPEEFAGEYVRTIRAVADSGEPLEIVERAPRRDGSVGEFLVYKFPLPGGEWVGGVAIDISERLRAEEQLRDADRRKDEFLALLAHELRNPLAPLRNGLQVMRLAGMNGEAAERARAVMERQLGHMVRLIDDLLDISRISRNKLELRRERVLLADVVASAVETARPALDAAGHEFAVALPPEPVYLDADLTRLAQVFSNLLTNAAKYTERGGNVWLTAAPGDDEVVVAVRDTGIGIPAEALPSIFDMFSQVDRSIERATGGLGIGLALVKGLVEMHGGRVAAASGGPGAGSTFSVTLPRERERLFPAAPDVGPGGSVGRGPIRRILVVDDSRDSAQSMAAMLQLLGHDVRTAHDGVEAVAAAEAFRPDVILMDIGMPRLNGYDATRRIRAQPWGRDMTVVAVTGWGQAGDRARSRVAGCDGHLVKPVCLEDLMPFVAEPASRPFKAGERAN
jgi:PAS domain S-box-containing protein